MKTTHVILIVIFLLALWWWWSKREGFVPVYCSTRNGNECVDLGTREQTAYSGP